MKLFEILNEFLQGKKIHRTSWNQSVWIEYVKVSKIVRLYHIGDDGIKLIAINMRFSIDDILANDWEFYDK
jgi:hypothetical protein